MIADAGLAIAAAGLTALIAWGPPHLSGTPITGPGIACQVNGPRGPAVLGAGNVKSE